MERLLDRSCSQNIILLGISDHVDCCNIFHNRAAGRQRLTLIDIRRD